MYNIMSTRAPVLLSNQSWFTIFMEVSTIRESNLWLLVEIKQSSTVQQHDCKGSEKWKKSYLANNVLAANSEHLPSVECAGYIVQFLGKINLL